MLIVSICVSCVFTSEFVKIKYTSHISFINTKYMMYIPNDYIDYFVITAGESESERDYLYKDSSIIYITDYDVPYFNSKNIKALGDSISNFRFQSYELIELNNKLLKETGQKVYPDTVELSGINEKSLYWKDVRIKQISIGYCNVPKEKKEIFDKALKTLKIK
jgi:hypothetical protein